MNIYMIVTILYNLTLATKELNIISKKKVASVDRSIAEEATGNFTLNYWESIISIISLFRTLLFGINGWIIFCSTFPRHLCATSSGVVSLEVRWTRSSSRQTVHLSARDHSWRCRAQMTAKHRTEENTQTSISHNRVLP